jgi:hypothetical protein
VPVNAIPAQPQGTALRRAPALISIKAPALRFPSIAPRRRIIMSAQAAVTTGVRHMLESIARRWRDHRDAVASLREIDRMDSAMAGEIAAEAGLSVADLKEVISHGVGANRLMQRMMDAYGVDVRELAEDGVLRDVSVLCSRCRARGRCAEELEAGTARENAHLFCPNAETFESFGLEPS